MNENKTKNVLITGSSSGIGLALTQYYLNNKATVTGIDLNPSPEIKETTQKSSFNNIIADLSDLSEIQETVNLIKANNS